MKTNTLRKTLLSLATVVILSSFTVSVFADSEKSKSDPSESKQTASETVQANKQQKENNDRSVSEKPARKPNSKDEKRQGRPMKHDDDWFENWFEDSIDAREHVVDFSKLPENPTDEEIVEFFRENFLNKTEKDGNADTETNEQPSKGHHKHFSDDSKPEHPKKHDNDIRDWFEDWFEDRIEAREHAVDFNELPENPTDEEMIEFFTKYFTGEKSDLDENSEISVQTEISNEADNIPSPEIQPDEQPATESEKDQA